MEKEFGEFLNNWILNLGVQESIAVYVKLGILMLIMIFLSLFLLFIGRNIILNTVYVIASKSKTNFDDLLVENKVFYKISFVLPVFAFYIFDSIIFQDFPKLHPIIESATNLVLLWVIVWSLDAFLVSLRQFLESKPYFKNKPINSYFQLLKIIIYLIAIIFLISILIGKSPIYLLTGLGAISAVLILVFKDTILGFMASIQIAMNNMVSVGDWVSVPQYGADGTILEINLVTVKVKNWDQTISTLPTYAFISDSFVNWRGMEESGGRRIKQHLYINNKTIKFADEELIARLKKIQILKPYLESKIIEIEEFNKLKNADKSELANGRHLTNIGIFRKYASLYIESHPMINENMTRMVRQLQSTSEGLPLEIYCFSKDKAWVNFEGIKADIFDHLFAVAKKFDLEVFQKPSGSDFQNAFQLKN